MAEINKTEDQKLEQKLARQKHLRENHKRNTADLVVECLVNEGVEVVFGIPGEENIPLLEAIERDGRIRFVLTRHEQGAGFMAANIRSYYWKTGRMLGNSRSWRIEFNASCSSSKRKHYTACSDLRTR